ncbi:hypothetical protein BJX68DRAFT_278354 [Aspergillus pseudodeflectus]|uniref:Uncharacterized protein n=1 Tax=Aspergillus pseudodeflectus TaxID=176178 RepID=A0ABR4JRL2_9EURO
MSCKTYFSIYVNISLSLTLAAVKALLFSVNGYEGVSKRTTSAQVVIQAAALGARGVGNAITLLTVFLIRVMSSIIGCRLFSFPKISCPDGCSRVFLAKVITLLRKVSKD